MLRAKDFVASREEMVDEQLISRGINNKKVLRSMRSVPREKFIPKRYQNQAYGDFPLEIGRGQTISQPYIVALMTQLLELKGQERVLEIGTGSGYQAAILSKLAKKVYSIERDGFLAKRATKLLKRLGFSNIKILIGDGYLGFKEAAPYQAIILTAAPPEVPLALFEQLDENGRLVAPVGQPPFQRLKRLKKVHGKIQEDDFGSVAFVPMMKGVEK